MTWKLYYHDRSTFSPEEGDWDDAPAFGVMAVVVRNEDVGYTRDNNDFYVMSPWGNGQPWACDVWGALDILHEKGAVTLDIAMKDIPLRVFIDNGIKFGRSIRTSEWLEVQQWIYDDPDFGPKSARWPYERP